MQAAATIDIDGTVLLQRTLESPARIVAHEGGSSSSKTWSEVQALIVHSFSETRATYSVVRKTLPALKRGALKDFQDILAALDLGGAFRENKTDHVYTNRQTETQIEFFALDNPQKARGPRRHRLLLNEANELTYEDFRQLAMRTRWQIFLDYNPSMRRSWVYDKVLTRTDCELIRSTYGDNPFLEDEVVREIEQDIPVWQEADGRLVVDRDLTYTGKGRLVAGDPERWAVYGLGQRGVSQAAIYPFILEAAAWPADAPSVLGLDFGYTHPMALLRLARTDPGPSPDNPRGLPELFIDELVHASLLTTDDLIERLPEVGVGRREEIFCDSARPDEIEKLRRAGYNALPAAKGAGSVYSGITWMKGHRLRFTRRSQRSREQFEGYRWKTLPDGTTADEPVKLDDDSPDAGRYGGYGKWGLPEPRPQPPSGATRAVERAAPGVVRGPAAGPERNGHGAPRSTPRYGR